MTQLSDEVVERVARAIAVAFGDDPELPSFCQHTLLTRGEGARIWEEWVREARAAIAAYEAKGDIAVDEG